EPPPVIARASAPASASPAALVVRSPREADETVIVAGAGMLANAATTVAEHEDYDEIDAELAHADGRDDHAHELGIDDDLATDGLAEHHETSHELGSDALAEPAADDDLV